MATHKPRDREQNYLYNGYTNIHRIETRMHKQHEVRQNPPSYLHKPEYQNPALYKVMLSGIGSEITSRNTLS